MSRRRTFLVLLLSCTAMTWTGVVYSQTAATGNLDAAGAVSHSSSLPPPAPLPGNADAAGALPNLPSVPVADTMPMPALPDAAGQAAMPGLPQTTMAPPAGTTVSPIQGEAAPLLTLPSLPTDSSFPAAVPQPQVPVVATPLPSASQSMSSYADVATAPPAMLGRVTAPGEMATQVKSTERNAPLLPSIPRQEILSLQKHPLPRINPDSPLIPGRSLAETTNQRRQLTSLPGSGGNTNYVHATVGGPEGPPRPLITPPTIVDPKPGYDLGKDYPALQAVMPLPEPTPVRWDEPNSPFGTPTPTGSLTYYVSRKLHQSPDRVDMNPSWSNSEIIVLRGGQEIQGLILERGDMWRVELMNGTIITMPGNKVSHIRKILAAPTSTPSTVRHREFPVQEYYREGLTH